MVPHRSTNLAEQTGSGAVTVVWSFLMVGGVIYLTYKLLSKAQEDTTNTDSGTQPKKCAVPFSRDSQMRRIITPHAAAPRCAVRSRKVETPNAQNYNTTPPPRHAHTKKWDRRRRARSNKKMCGLVQ